MGMQRAERRISIAAIDSPKRSVSNATKLSVPLSDLTMHFVSLLLIVVHVGCQAVGGDQSSHEPMRYFMEPLHALHLADATEYAVYRDVEEWEIVERQLIDSWPHSTWLLIEARDTGRDRQWMFTPARLCELQPVSIPQKPADLVGCSRQSGYSGKRRAASVRPTRRAIHSGCGAQHRGTRETAIGCALLARRTGVRELFASFTEIA